MPSLIRLLSLAKRVRRRSPRYLVPAGEPLVVGVAVADPDGTRHTLIGSVRDVSETGLSILLPEGETCRGLTAPGHPMAVVLMLPSGVIQLRAEVAHCSTRLGPRGGYLVGVRISEIASEDHGRLAEYIGGRS